MVSVHNANGAAPRPTRKARFELLTLGDELLLGLTANGHLTFIGGQLGRRGALLQRNVTITDEADAIAEQFIESWKRADVVITTGGLGPTCDDRTRDVIAEVLGQKLVFDVAIKQSIEERFRQQSQAGVRFRARGSVAEWKWNCAGFVGRAGRQGVDHATRSAE
jgi:nicotinamide-nucleotide amidase